MSIIPTKTFYVYLLCRPDSTPFYVGKGTGRRVLRHEIEARNGCDCHKCRTIRKIWSDGGTVQRQIVLTTTDEQEAFSLEISLIAEYGRDNLANQTDGGDGAVHLVTDATRARLRAVLPVVFNTPEAQKRRRASARLRWASEEERAKQRDRLKRALQNPEILAQKSASRKAMWESPEVRERMITALRSGRKYFKAKSDKTIPKNGENPAV